MDRIRPLDGLRRYLENRQVAKAGDVELIELSGPLLLVGSAPGSSLPKDFYAGWKVATINGSHGIASDWGIERPDVTALMWAHLTNESRNSPAVRTLLRGKRTGHLMIMGLDKPMPDAPARLSEMAYGYSSLVNVSSAERSRFCRDFLGVQYYDRVKSEKISNGIFMLQYALACGASPVVMTGIAPNTTGHAYNDLMLKRKHADADAQAIRLMHDRGYPVFTADENVAEDLQIPLWSGLT